MHVLDTPLFASTHTDLGRKHQRIFQKRHTITYPSQLRTPFFDHVLKSNLHAHAHAGTTRQTCAPNPGCIYIRVSGLWVHALHFAILRCPLWVSSYSFSVLYESMYVCIYVCMYGREFVVFYSIRVHCARTCAPCVRTSSPPTFNVAVCRYTRTNLRVWGAVSLQARTHMECNQFDTQARTRRHTHVTCPAR